MIKQKEYNLADSNVAGLGSDLDKKIRQAAAGTEQAWATAGKAVGVQIWRIEKFKVVAWPKDQYGSFYSGDSYIVLNTYKKKGGEAFCWDIHFWLGKFTTQDEAGTAAYKTVELDDLLGGGPVEYREVQGYESEAFLKLFNNQIKIMDGGVDSGFKHVEPEKYNPRLLHLKGKRKIRVTQVPMEKASMNSGDVFVLDAGLNLYQWNGSKSGPGEKMKGAQLCRAIDDERKGKATVHVMEEGDKNPDFWKFLGGFGAVKSAEEGGSDADAEKTDTANKRLFQLSDASGKMEFKEVATGAKCKKNLLNNDDVFILDTGAEVYAWIGKGASKDEKRMALQYAQDYLKKYNRPLTTPIARILQGGENEVWEHELS